MLSFTLKSLSHKLCSATSLRALGIATAAVAFLFAFQPQAKAITFACDIGGGCNYHSGEPGYCGPGFGQECTCIPLNEISRSGAAPENDPCDIE